MNPHAYRRESNAQSPLQIYLHDINDTPLLSAEEERTLAARVALGDPTPATTWSRPTFA